MSRRSFDSLRRTVAEPGKPDNDSLERVLQRIGLTRDGQLLLAWMADEILAPSHPGAADSVLREAEGRRRAFHEIIKKAEGGA